jgi:hypothetical protein
MKNIIIIPISFTLCLFAGCTSMVKMPQMDLSAFKPAGPVTSVVAAWEPAVSNDEKPMRGFGGRIYFYDQEMVRPVKIDGTVVVYAFDEDGRAESDSRPNEGYVFDAKTLNSKGVYKKSKLGHSYNLWIPWDSEGPDGQAKKISLIVRYIPKQGSQQTSQQATVRLPGRNMPELTTNFKEERVAGTIEQVAAQRPAIERRPLPERARLTEESVIESADRPNALQSFSIR